MAVASSAHVVQLANGVLKTMFTTKIILATLFLVAVGLLAVSQDGQLRHLQLLALYLGWKLDNVGLLLPHGGLGRRQNDDWASYDPVSLVDLDASPYKEGEVEDAITRFEV